MALSVLAIAWSASVASTVLWAAIRSRGRRVATPSTANGAIILRPCAGAERSLAAALDSTARVRASFPLAVRFAVATSADAALPFAESAASRASGAGIDASVVVTGAVGPNRKADQLARALALETSAASIVVVADSDVDLTDLSLDALVRPLDDPRVAAAWAAPVEVAPETFADRASAAVLDASLHAFPLLAVLDRAGMVGKLFAVRREALAQIGGFDALVEHLGEDMELARRLRAAGWGTAMAPVVAPSLAAGRAWGDVVARYARWIAVIRAQRPYVLAAYPGMLAATAPLVVVSLIAVALGQRGGWIALALTLVARAGAAALARSRTGRPLRPAALALDAALADVVLAFAFARALGSRRTVWRGVELRQSAAGTFTEEGAR